MMRLKSALSLRVEKLNRYLNFVQSDLSEISPEKRSALTMDLTHYVSSFLYDRVKRGGGKDLPRLFMKIDKELNRIQETLRTFFFEILTNAKKNPPKATKLPPVERALVVSSNHFYTALILSNTEQRDLASKKKEFGPVLTLLKSEIGEFLDTMPVDSIRQCQYSLCRGRDREPRWFISTYIAHRKSGETRGKKFCSESCAHRWFAQQQRASQKEGNRGLKKADIDSNLPEVRKIRI